MPRILKSNPLQKKERKRDRESNTTTIIERKGKEKKKEERKKKNFSFLTLFPQGISLKEYHSIPFCCDDVKGKKRFGMDTVHAVEKP
ncbi:hypothetical protein CEXT_113691 [Caerostris extrusa]|uniref:Uncharacterized protein n=1 Tax=Caerostris extrusa TaxID=172846 RepID=A0AAV4QXS1_CAEEX|nr:hypothetical protein CEXT_113691 [Caerostris extrusa]